MVVSLSSTAQFCNVVSIPRDTLTSAEKINEVYSRGGLRATVPAVEKLLGVPIDRYVVVRLYRAKQFLDALGGLELEVPRRLRYSDRWARLEIDLKPGRQVLTGQEALGYARYLDPRDGDHGRLHRHRQLVKAGLRKLKDPAVVMKAPELAKAFKECCETDLKIVLRDRLEDYGDGGPRRSLFQVRSSAVLRGSVGGRRSPRERGFGGGPVCGPVCAGQPRYSAGAAALPGAAAGAVPDQALRAVLPAGSFLVRET